MQISLTDKQMFQTDPDTKIGKLRDLQNKIDNINGEINTLQIDLKALEYQKKRFDKKTLMGYLCGKLRRNKK
ncbi:MAG: hypothetical protein LBS15_01845 [Endomicrobium sp.]|jgi:hypothetical protein|nr:hypothetical protein [Endomicrobium sp.]